MMMNILQTISFNVIDEDPSKETEAIVENFVDTILESGHIRLERAKFVKCKLLNTKPEPYYKLKYQTRAILQATQNP